MNGYGYGYNNITDPRQINKVGMGLLIFGIFLFLFGIFMSFGSHKSKDECTATTKGVIVEIISSNKKGNVTRRTTFYPIVEYTVNSKTYRHKVTNPGHRNMFKEGDTMEIHYDPQNPDNAYVDRETNQQSGLGVLLFIMAGLMFVGAIIVFIKASKMNR